MNPTRVAPVILFVAGLLMLMAVGIWGLTQTGPAQAKYEPKPRPITVESENPQLVNAVQVKINGTIFWCILHNGNGIWCTERGKAEN